jgi:hypothetical protein
MLPMRALGRAIAASADDRTGVVGICRSCDSHLEERPHLRDRVHRAVERALLDPSKYMCTLYDDHNTVMLAVALIGHPTYALDALSAVGWIAD